MGTNVRYLRSAIAATLVFAAPVQGQTADPADVSSPEAVIRAAYESLTRAPGENSDWDRLRSLHLPEARLAPNPEQTGGEPRVMTIEEFIDWIEGSVEIGGPEDQGFAEEGIHLVTREYGDVAQLISTYESRFHGSEQVIARGINFLTLVRREGRWWVLSVAWDEENAAGPIPAEYLDARSSGRPSDVESIDAVINASYATLQRAPGEPFQWERYRSLRLPGALLVPNSEQSGGQFAPRTVEEHIAIVDAWYAENMPVGSPQDQGFAEEEIHREVHRYGDVAHVESTYVKRFHDSEEILGRGINFYTLVFDGERWWISAAAWDEENGAGEIPAKYLP